MEAFIKESSRFYGINYDNQKEKMKTHFLCMGLGYWLITKVAKTIISEDNLESCTKEQRDLFMCDMRARKAILSRLLENVYNQVKEKIMNNKACESLEVIYEGDKNSKRVKLHNWTCLFQEA